VCVLVCVRFAYECGGKWLYPNLPGNLSLVSNYREQGENYPSTLGPSTELLHDHHLFSTKVDRHDRMMSSGLIEYDYTTSCLWYFPSPRRLSRWQFDLRVQRIGKSSGAIYDLSRFSSPSASPLKPSLPSPLSRGQLIEMLNLIESYLPLYGHIISLGETPLLFPLWKLSLGHHHLLLTHCTTTPSPPILCLPLPDLHSRYQSLRPVSTDLLIVNLEYAKRNQVDLQEVWNWILMQDSSSNNSSQSSIHELKYLVVYGEDVITAPTEITFSTTVSEEERKGRKRGNSCDMHSFTLVEDLCSEDGFGMTIYRNTKTLPSHWVSHRHGVTKRIASGLLTRRMIERRETTE
jgi:hypothetical protein